MSVQPLFLSKILLFFELKNFGRKALFIFSTPQEIAA